MNKEKTNKNMKKMFYVITAILLIIQPVQSLILNEPGTHTIAEKSTLATIITTTENNGTVNFTINPQKGTITQLSETTAKYEWTPTISDSGTYNIEITAKDNTETKKKTMTITVTNTNEPIIILEKNSPGTITQNKANLEITTNKPATCKYSLTQKPYAEMEYTFQKNSEGTTHTGTTPTLTQGTHTTHILCEDEYKNHLTETETITFTINLKPSAAISLNPEPPLRTERVKITVKTSEDLMDAPEIKYYFDDDATPISVTMVGSGSVWTGYMIIRESTTERVGTFTFKGTDLSNQIGTEITSGKIFLVNNKMPEQIRSISAENQENGIKISWSYEDSQRDNIEEYKIYRKTGSGGTDFVDYYKTTTKEYYLDTDVEINKAYYYKVTAIDDAGNEGPLSKEVFTTHVPTNINELTQTEQTTTTNTPKLNPILKYKLDALLTEVQKTIFNVEEAEKRVGRAEGKEKLEAVQSLRLMQKIASQKNKIINLQNGLKALENQDLTSNEFETKTKTILEQIKAAWEETPTNIEIIESSAYKETSDDTKTELATRLIAQHIGLTDEKKIKEHLENNKKLQDQITIEAQVIITKIIYPETEKKAATIIKTISTNQLLSKISLVEIIPKNIAEKAQDILFSETPEIIQDDPVVRWNLESLSQKKITYSVINELNIVEAKTTNTIILSGIQKENIGENEITGYASKDNETSRGKNPLIYPIILGIIIASILTIYYFYNNEETEAERKGHIENGFMKIKQKLRERKTRIVPERAMQDSKKIIFQEQDIHAVQTKEKVSGESIIITKKETETEKPEMSPENEITPEKSTEISHKASREEQNQVEELSELYKEIQELTKNTENKSIEDISRIQSETARMRTLLDEIEQKNIEEYTNHAKKILEEALKYLVTQEKMHKTRKEYDAILDRQVPENKCFIMKNGLKLRTLRELSNALKHIDSETYNFHCNENKNDFANWIRDVIGEQELAHKIRSAKTKQEIIRILNI